MISFKLPPNTVGRILELDVEKVYIDMVMLGELNFLEMYPPFGAVKMSWI
jgi:hypothetical protein